MTLRQAIRLARQEHKQAERALAEEIAIASVSTVPEHREQCRQNALWLLDMCAAIGMRSYIFESQGGHPTVVGEWSGAGPTAPWLTIYGHYDVQPSDPIEEWTSPPFDARIADGCIYGRGAVDNKGMHMAFMRAIKYAVTVGGPPVNLRVLIEGEEESGGSTLQALLRTRADELKTDFALICDGTLLTVLTGLRGLLYTEIRIQGADHDLHSGIFGGVAPNPLNSLCSIIAALKSQEGLVLIPGFYDDVEPPSSVDSTGLHDDEAAIISALGSTTIEGESAFSVMERATSRPTLDAHGVIGGNAERGTVKTVIPAAATAQVSMRLVPRQDPARVLELLRRYVSSLATHSMHVEVTSLASSAPQSIDPAHYGVSAAIGAFEQSFGQAPSLVRAGYSIPIVSQFLDALTPNVIVTGFGRHDEGAHAPNERFRLDSYHRGTEMVLHLMWSLAAKRFSAL
jgi:acetylornithine deacetylase/succinyl-diaminopimelate desuccinylase-like protein